MLDIEFFITSLIVVLIPGTGVIYTVSVGLFRGPRASAFAAVGCTAGIVPHLCASIVGLTAIMHMSATVFHFVKLAGVAYLLYLAWSMWRDSSAIQPEAAGKENRAFQIVLRGFLINILNPKLSLFFLAFLPQFIPPQAQSPLSLLLVMSAIFMAMTLVVFVLYGLIASQLRQWVLDHPSRQRRLQRGFAGAFALLGLRLAVAER